MSDIIVVRAPLRISFIGGGSDLPEYYGKFGGSVISVTINKFTIINLVRLAEGEDWEVTGTRGIGKQLWSGTHGTKIIKEAISAKELPYRVGALILSDLVQLGSGLGSSSALAVAITAAMSEMAGEPGSASDLAERSFRLERELCGAPVGKQDHYAASHGGFRRYRFYPDDSTAVEELPLPPQTQQSLQDRLILFRLQRRTEASRILTDHASRLREGGEALARQHRICELVDAFERALLRADYEELADVMHESWIAKRRISSSISTTEIDDFYDRARRAGARGGKVLGAGGGGHLLFIAEPDDVSRVVDALPDLQHVPFQMTKQGARIIHGAVQARG